MNETSTTERPPQSASPSEHAAPFPFQLLDVQEVADLLSCSTRHIYRLADAGNMPKPVKLGHLNRWPANVIEDWIAAGCPSVRRFGRG